MPDAPRIVPLKPAAAAAPRASSTARGYDWAHRRQRKRLIALHPVCQRCSDAFSAHLHHIDRNTRNRADSNIEMLCERCHQAEHADG